MKINPKQKKRVPHYPAKSAFLKESNRLALSLAVAGMGTGLIFSANAAEKEKKAKTKIEKKTTYAELEKKIKEQIALLGDKDYKKRKSATFALIKIGTSATVEIKKFLVSALNKELKSKDPEIRLRAKRIIAAVNKEKKREKIIQPVLKGEIAIEPLQ